MEPLGCLFTPEETFDPRLSEGLPLLTESELIENGIPLPTSEDSNGNVAQSHEDLPVFDTIHAIRKDILENIDDPYSAEQLRSPRMNKFILRPMVDRWHSKNDISVIYCFLVNRLQFLREQADQIHHQTVATTRATLCEIVASRLIRRYDEDLPGPAGLLLLANILVSSFMPFQNAPEDIIDAHCDWPSTDATHRRKSTALELAILSQSKVFLSAPSCQKVIEAIYQGRIVYTPTSYMDLLPDHYKLRPITLYDPRTRPLLNQYRLIVPRTRNILELASFVVLLILYILVMEERDISRISPLETVFCVYAWGWVLEQFANMIEHGWKVYTQNLWAFLDVIFLLDYLVYFGMRMNAHRIASEEQAQLAFHVLAAGAPMLVPRIAFNLLSENMLFVSLRAMMSNFLVLTLLAVWCFGGFLLAMNWMNNGQHGPVRIGKWMLYVWFGLDGTGIQKSVEFHWLLGPILMVTFAFLGNTLFLTILVSMLSHTFSQIVSNATAEIQFRRAVLTFECVKADAIFAFFPPFNILALLFFLPMKFVLSPRWFHKVVVTAVRVLNMPLLLAIGLYERRVLWAEERARRAALAGASSSAVNARKQSVWTTLDWSVNVHSDLENVFDAEPEARLEDGSDQGEEDAVDESIESSQILDSSLPAAKEAVPARPNMFSRTVSSNTITQTGANTQGPRRRKDSMSMPGLGDVAEHLQGILGEYDAEGTKERMDGLEDSLARVEAKLDRLLSAFGGLSGRVTPTPGRPESRNRKDTDKLGDELNDN